MLQLSPKTMRHATQTMTRTDIIPTQTQFNDKYGKFVPVLPSFNPNILSFLHLRVKDKYTLFNGVI